MLLHAAVIMPEHVHLLLTPLRDVEGWPVPLSRILKRIKGTSARSVNRLLRSEGPVWQEESFDHVLRYDESLEEKLEYIRQNTGSERASGNSRGLCDGEIYVTQPPIGG